MANPKNEKMAAITAKQDITIELATRPALRLWQGREKTDKKHGILGIPGFCKLVRSIEQAIREDDPYADYHFSMIDEGIKSLTFDLDMELKDIQSFIDENIPPAMKVPEIGSKNPVVVPIRFASRMGFQMVHQLLKVDQIVLKVLLANHVGILANNEKFETLARVEKRVRSVIHLVFAYKHTGVSRDDMAAKNQKAMKAIELMGPLEQAYLEGTKRSDNAPQLPQKRLTALGSNFDVGNRKNRRKNTDVLSSEELDSKLDELIDSDAEQKGLATA